MFNFSAKVCKTKENGDWECVKYYNKYIVDSLMENGARLTS